MDLTRKIWTPISLVKFWLNAAPNGAVQTPQQLADFVLGLRGVAPWQVREELIEFATLVKELRPKSFLEIGTHRGGTFFVLCRLSDPQATVISLDLPGGEFGSGYSSYRIPVLRRMKATAQMLHLLRTDSHDPRTRERVAEILSGAKLDLLLIDGDHTYEGVKCDFEMYSPFVRPGGIVAFHDVVPHPADTGCEVDRFWDEIKTRYRSREIVADRKQGWAGIGVLYV